MTEIIDGQIAGEYEETERAVLGTMLSYSRSQFIEELLTEAHRLRLRPEIFFAPEHCLIYGEILQLDEQGKKPRLHSIVEGLAKKEKLESAGGAEYIESLCACAQGITKFEDNVNKLKSRYARSGLFRIARHIYKNLFDSYSEEKADYRSIMENAVFELFNLSEKMSVCACEGSRELLRDSIEFIDKQLKEKKRITGVPSGFTELDLMTGGFQPSQYIVISGDSQAGKTSLALSMLEHIAVSCKTAAAFFTFETTGDVLMRRILALANNVDFQSVNNGTINVKDAERIYANSEKMIKNPFYVVDQPMNLVDIHTMSRKLKEFQNIKILFIDYLNLLRCENADAPNGGQLAKASKFIKLLARELKIPVVALFQTNRNSTAPDKLGGLGGIENDADTVIALTREKDAEKAKLHLVKHRNGKTGETEIDFLPWCMKFAPVKPDNVIYFNNTPYRKCPDATFGA